LQQGDATYAAYGQAGHELATQAVRQTPELHWLACVPPWVQSVQAPPPVPQDVSVSGWHIPALSMQPVHGSASGGDAASGVVPASEAEMHEPFEEHPHAPSVTAGSKLIGVPVQQEANPVGHRSAVTHADTLQVAIGDGDASCAPSVSRPVSFARTSGPPSDTEASDETFSGALASVVVVWSWDPRLPASGIDSSGSTEKGAPPQPTRTRAKIARLMRRACIWRLPCARRQLFR